MKRILIEPIEIELVEADGSVPKMPIEEAKPKVKKEKAKYKISPETLAEFVLIYYDEGEVARRWSPKLSRAFLKMNRNGWHDLRFSEAYPTLKQHYPSAERDAVSDPYKHRGGALVADSDYPIYNESHRIPRDFEPILAEIMERRKN